ncbi:hypothetical protein QEN19_003281 [Hanseniaspora menglaensis]
MGLSYKDEFVFPKTNFQDFAFSIINRYPNPFAPHIKSVDIISRRLLPTGNGEIGNNKLMFTRLIRKLGSLPKWTPSVLRITDSFILETVIVNPKEQVIHSRQQNLDHTHYLKVIEVNKYQYDPIGGFIKQTSNVEFVSEVNHKSENQEPKKSMWERLSSRVHFGDTIEKFSLKTYNKRIMKSREGIIWKLEYYKLKQSLFARGHRQ